MTLIKTFYFQSDIMSKWNRKRNHLGRNSSNNERLKIPFIYQSFESLESSSLTKTKDHEMTTTHVFKLESITCSLKKLEKYFLVHNLPALTSNLVFFFFAKTNRLTCQRTRNNHDYVQQVIANTAQLSKANQFFALSLMKSFPA